MGNPKHTDMRGLVIECASVQNDAGVTISVVPTAKPTVTFTSGSAPATNGSVTIANSATPTVVELLELIYELQAKLVTAGVLT